MLDYLLSQVISRVQNIIDSPVFQQDNTPIHNLQIAQAFFDQDHITVKDWPAISPDLTQIEHDWVELKCWLHMKCPDIKNTRGGPNKVYKRLAVVLTEIWAEIPEEFFEKVWKSMPGRVATVISAEGWYT
jgi:hypothetical protein